MTLQEKALNVLKNNKVAIFVVAYNAESHLESVLRRIPQWMIEDLAEIYVIDDCSTDQTYKVGKSIEWDHEKVPLQIYRIPQNVGYGGNQKLGYRYAIKKEFDIVVLLHGDGQYSPEALPEILAPYDDGADAVFGSRFMERGAAVAGGMPKYKFIGNRILTYLQNKLLGTQLSEFHSGYRSYRTSALAKVPFSCNSNSFDFDADIIVQMVKSKAKLIEVPIPTYYGDEICHVNGMLYAYQCIRTFTKNFLMKFEIFYDPKFDIEDQQPNYIHKKASTSLHAHIENRVLPTNSRILDLGCGEHGENSAHFKAQGHEVTGVDLDIEEREGYILMDLDQPWSHEKLLPSYDTILALDVIEHLKRPEQGVNEIYSRLSKNGYCYASTGNVAFIIIRFMLLIGAFKYGKRGILDLTHTRLMTQSSFRRLMENAGFIVEETHAFGVPLADLKPKSTIFKILDRISWSLAKFWPGLFAYQILLKCKRPVSLNELETEMFEKEQNDG